MPGWNAFTPLINDATIYHTHRKCWGRVSSTLMQMFINSHHFDTPSFSLLLPSSLFALNLMTHSSRMKNYFCTFFIYLSHCVTFVVRCLKDSRHYHLVSNVYFCSYSLKSMNNDRKWDGINFLREIWGEGKEILTVWIKN